MLLESRKRVEPTCAKTTVDANPDAEKSNTLVRDMTKDKQKIKKTIVEGLQ